MPYVVKQQCCALYLTVATTVTVHMYRYRTQWCHDGSKCTRTICFFAHSLEVGNWQTADHTNLEFHARHDLSAV
jgi:hypothetical protein